MFTCAFTDGQVSEVFLVFGFRAGFVFVNDVYDKLLSYMWSKGRAGIKASW